MDGGGREEETGGEEGTCREERGDLQSRCKINEKNSFKKKKEKKMRHFILFIETAVKNI